MSEIINNREQVVDTSNRQALLMSIIVDVRNGKSIAEVKERFVESIGSITAEELTQLELSLVEEGIPVDNLHHLCSVHAAVLKDTNDDKGLGSRPEHQPGHPVHTFVLENKEISRLVFTSIQPNYERFTADDNEENIYKLIEDLNLLLDVDKHYSRKENLLFPYLEKYGIFGPSKMMWGIDDFIRDAIKLTKRQLTNYDGDKVAVSQNLSYVIREVIDMVNREENILFPMALNTLTEDEWIKIAHESDEIGYCLTGPAAVWKPERKELHANAMTDGFIKMETGILSLKQLELMLNHLPIDLTFIDKDDVVRYFSHGKERIFARTKAVIGRTIQNCHPPRSVHTVEDLLADFKSGRKDAEDFWIKFKDKYVYIRYFAVRDVNGEYIGTLEFTQNISPIQEINGEKRMLT